METWPRTRLRNLIEPVQNGVWGADPVGDDDDILCVRVADFDRRRFGLKAVETVRGSDDQILPYIRAGNIQDSGLRLSDVNEMPYSAVEAANLNPLAGDLLVVEGGAIGTNVVVTEDMAGWP